MLAFKMKKTAMFHSLLLLSFCLVLMIMIFTSRVEHHWAINYTHILLEASEYTYRRRGSMNDIPKRNYSTMNSNHCQNNPSTLNTSTEDSDGKVQNVATIPMTTVGKSRSTKHGYLLLDSNKELDLHCKHCALVFSSGHLLGSNMGREIDRADCVIRQNTATVRNHIDDVGMRTTVRVIGHSNFKQGLLTPKIGQSEILLSPNTRPSIIYVPWLYKESINRTTHEVFKTSRRLSTRFPKVKFYFQTDDMINDMDSRFMNETGLNRTEIKSWFSTGYMSVLFALDVCDNVVCYGVSDVDYCRREPKSQVRYHYYDTGKNRPLECSYFNDREYMVKGGHKFLTEKKLYAKWAQHKHLTFRAPTWPESAFNLSGEFESPYLSVYKKAKEDGSFANIAIYVKPGIKNNPKPLSNAKVRRPILKRSHRIRRPVGIPHPSYKKKKTKMG